MSGPTEFPGGENPFQAPLASSGPSPFAPLDNVRNGPPWEQTEKPLVGRYIETVVLAYTNTTILFFDMRREGGFGAPLFYVLISGMIGGVIGAIPQFLFQGLAMGAGGNQQGAAAFAILGVGATIGILVFLPVYLVVGTFISAALCHVMLMLLGGANYPYETSFRAVAYGWGSATLVQALPFCGQYVSIIVGAVFIIIGMMKVHEISGLKATAVVLLPVVVCCGGILATAFAVGIGIAVSGI